MHWPLFSSTLSPLQRLAGQLEGSLGGADCRDGRMDLNVSVGK